MLPRAYKCHRWYLARFPGYQQERRAIIPFLFGQGRYFERILLNACCCCRTCTCI